MLSQSSFVDVNRHSGNRSISSSAKALDVVMVILRVLERDDGCRVLDSIKHDFSFDSYYFIKVCVKYAKKLQSV